MQDTTETAREYQKWVEAFTIFCQYENSSYDGVSAEHDIVYAGPNPEIVSEEHIKQLETLGWHIEEDFECFYKFV